VLHCFATPLLGLVAIPPVQSVGGRSTPSFAAAPGSPYLVGDAFVGGPSAVVSADFNLDGRPDLAVAAGVPAEIQVLLGDGTGGFTAHGEGLFSEGMLGDSRSKRTTGLNSRPLVWPAGAGRCPGEWLG